MKLSSTSAWQGKTRGGTWGNLFFIFLIRRLGIGFAYFFLCFVIVYFIPFSPRSTVAIWCYARGMLKYGRIRSIGFLFRCYYRFGQILIDKVAIGSGLSENYSFDFVNYPPFLELLNGQQGVVMIGAHVGNWEVGAPFFEEYGKKINIVMYDSEYQKIKELFENYLDGKNYKIIPVNEGDLTPVFRIKDALDRKEYVCFQGDRFVHGQPVLEINFMGRKACFPAGPFQLASRLGLPVVFYFAMREKGRKYRFHFTVADPVMRTKERKPEEALLEQYAGILAQIVKRYPEQWFNFYRFWDSGRPVS